MRCRTNTCGPVSNALVPKRAAALRSIRARAVAEPPGKAVDKVKSQLSNQDLVQTTPNIGNDWAEHSGETYQVRVYSHDVSCATTSHAGNGTAPLWLAAI